MDEPTQEELRKEQIREELRKIDDFISRLENEYVRKIELGKGVFTWNEFLQDHEAICGVGRTWTHIFAFRKRRKQLVRSYAESIGGRMRELGGGPDRCDLAGLKDAIKKTLVEILGDGTVVMDKEGEIFLSYLYYLTVRAYLTPHASKKDEERYRDDQEEDTKSGQLLEPTIIELDEEAAKEITALRPADEDSIIHDVDEKMWRDSLAPEEREIWKDHEAGYGVRDTAKRRKCGKSKVAVILKKLKEKRKEEA